MRETSKRYICDVCSGSKRLRMVERAVMTALVGVTIDGKATATVQAKQRAQARADLEVQLTALQARLDRLHDRRADMGIAHVDGELDDEQYRRGTSKTDRDLANVMQQIEQVTARMEHLPAHADMLTEILDQLPTDYNVLTALHFWPVERTQGVYRACIKKVTVDHAANMVHIEYADHLQPLWGPGADVVMTR